MFSACALLSPLQKRSKVYSSLRNDCIASAFGAIGWAALGASGAVRVVGRGREAFSGVRVRVFIDFQFPLHAGAFPKRLVDSLLEGFAQCLHHFFCKDSTGNADIQHSFCVSVELQRPRPSVEQFGRSLLLQRLHTSVPQILHSVLSVREL